MISGFYKDFIYYKYGLYSASPTNPPQIVKLRVTNLVSTLNKTAVPLHELLVLSMKIIPPEPLELHEDREEVSDVLLGL